MTGRLFLTAGCLALLLAACRIEPIYNVTDSLIPARPGHTRSLDHVRKAILRSKGDPTVRYRMFDAKPGLIQCELIYKARHKAWVDIPYTATGYSILYQKSENLRYYPASEEGPETIKAHYNDWIQALHASIQSELEAKPLAAPTAQSSHSTVPTDAESRMRQLQKLRDANLISQEEFKRKREQILDAL